MALFSYCIIFFLCKVMPLNLFWYLSTTKTVLSFTSPNQTVACSSVNQREVSIQGFAKSRPVAMARGPRHTSQPAPPCDLWSGSPLHSSHPAIQFRILVSGILQRIFWSVSQNGRRWVLVPLQFQSFQCSAILASFCFFMLMEKRYLYMCVLR